MPVFVTQGRYSQSAVKAMLANPEDRGAAVAKLIEQAGGTLIDYYVLFGEYDWMIIYELPSGKEAAAGGPDRARCRRCVRHEDDVRHGHGRSESGLRGRAEFGCGLSNTGRGLITAGGTAVAHEHPRQHRHRRLPAHHVGE